MSLGAGFPASGEIRDSLNCFSACFVSSALDMRPLSDIVILAHPVQVPDGNPYRITIPFDAPLPHPNRRILKKSLTNFVQARLQAARA
jgi:hypothetical protein